MGQTFRAAWLLEDKHKGDAALVTVSGYLPAGPCVRGQNARYGMHYQCETGCPVTWRTRHTQREGCSQISLGIAYRPLPERANQTGCEVQLEAQGFDSPLIRSLADTFDTSSVSARAYSIQGGRGSLRKPSIHTGCRSVAHRSFGLWAGTDARRIGGRDLRGCLSRKTSHYPCVNERLKDSA
ncbi:hypothetical protein MGYG_09087 [Nannizzia gypsea CBS 118893]|uniref:Uncharacterized protein n=1 Tax=Arthroderma gypseum (strain ATCC MYA-4604 / CBS 118893) TaxID=535722 RepID=E4UW33_ARTGP|nr:hypothetical protein MGYG_09087 [Nannizzia gypsea CBS 118893]EFR02481.1 hypothetical protein MGYG_09087 [Nannizzia gypsea CBS 118893]